MRTSCFQLLSSCVLLAFSRAAPPINTRSILNSQQLRKGSTRVQLIIDTDAVTDDLRGISLALNHPDVEVIAFTTVHGCVDVDQATANILRVQRANGLPKKIPIFKGARFPLLKRPPTDESFFFGKDGLGDHPDVEPRSRATDAQASEAQFAPEALLELTRKHPNATLVAIGPLTNVALALKLDPDFGKRLRKFVMMGGSYLGIGNVDSLSTAESNINGDPEAAEIVLREMDAPMLIVPWEVFFIEGSKHEKKIDFSAHMDYNTPLAHFLKAVTSRVRLISATHKEQYAHGDEAAVAAAIDEERVVREKRTMRGSVELAGRNTRGQLALDWRSVKWDGTFEATRATDLSRRQFDVLTEYNAVLVDQWMHRATQRSKKITDLH